MYIITVLTVGSSEVEIIDAYNNELEAQNNYLNKVSELSKSEDKNIIYESVFASKSKANIFRRESGWLFNYKDIYKIVTLHVISNYNISDA